MSKEFAQKLGLKGIKTNLKAELGTNSCSNELVFRNLEICIGQARFKIRPYIVDWIAYDLILGKVG